MAPISSGTLLDFVELSLRFRGQADRLVPARQCLRTQASNFNLTRKSEIAGTPNELSEQCTPNCAVWNSCSICWRNLLISACASSLAALIRAAFSDDTKCMSKVTD
jgi:hypothetical protein